MYWWFELRGSCGELDTSESLSWDIKVEILSQVTDDFLCSQFPKIVLLKSLHQLWTVVTLSLHLSGAGAITECLIVGNGVWISSQIVHMERAKPWTFWTTKSEDNGAPREFTWKIKKSFNRPTMGKFTKESEVTGVRVTKGVVRCNRPCCPISRCVIQTLMVLAEDM